MDTVNLQSLKLPDLKARCKQLGLTGYSKLNKAQLIARLQDSAKLSSTDATVLPIPSSKSSPPSFKKDSSHSVRDPVPLSAQAPHTATTPAQIPSHTIQQSPSIPNPSAIHTPPSAPKINQHDVDRLPAASIVSISGKSVRPGSTKNPTSTSRPTLERKLLPTPVDRSSPPEPPLVADTSLNTVGKAVGTKRGRSPSAPKANKLAKAIPKLKKATATTVTKRARPAVVLTRTRPATTSLPVSPSSTSTQIVPHRLHGQSNATFLSHHFSTQILRQLRPELDRPSSHIMLGPVLNGTEESFTIALRFYISRLHTTLHMGGGEAWSVAAGNRGLLSPDIAKWPVITACKSLGGDIWSIETDNDTYLGLGSTGEVIHRSKTGELQSSLRADWTAYLLSPVPILTTVRSKDPNDFPLGVSRAFRGADEVRGLAERVVLSSCVLQSLSGQSMSVIAMESEWLGQPSALPHLSGHVQLFLPESHQVVSAHLTQHPSVGVVQRNGGYRNTSYERLVRSSATRTASRRCGKACCLVTASVTLKNIRRSGQDGRSDAAARNIDGKKV